MFLKRLMKKSIVILFCVLCIGIFSGCGNEKVEVSNDDNTVETIEKTSLDQITEEIALTNQELNQWTDYVNSQENNAFLLSYYDEPNQIDLHELFYTGCGFDMEKLTETEVQQYLEWMETDEIYTDMTHITGEQVEYVLKQRLGLTMEDMEHPLNWCYLKDSDDYLMQHGDTNYQSFVCIEGKKNGNQVVLDCFSKMTEKTCRVTLELSEDSSLWMFVSNVEIANDEETVDNDEAVISGDSFEDNIFISDEAYMDVQKSLGEENAQQLSVFAENYEKWIPEEGETAGGTLGLAVYDLDKDGQLELICALVQGTGLYACNRFYHAEVENGLVWELEQESASGYLAFEIETKPPTTEWSGAYQDEEGRILYMAADYGKAGLQSAACTEGYYYLENGKVVSEEICSCVVEYYESEDGIYKYYLPGLDEPVEKEVWESVKQDFPNGKKALDVNICWKNLYDEEIAEKKVQGWFLLLAESLEDAG